MENIIFLLVIALGAPLLALLGYLGKLAFDALANKAKASKLDYLAKVVSRLDDAILTVVKSVHQAFVSPLKDKDNFSEEDKKMAKALALAELKSYLGEKGLREIFKALDPKDNPLEQDKLLATHIEAAVVDIKK